MGSAAPGMGGLPTYRYDVLGWEVKSSITIRILIGGIRRQVTIPVYDLAPKKIRRRK